MSNETKTALKVAAILAILFAIIAFPLRAQMEGFALNKEEVRLLIRDSDNAHLVAKAALGSVACMLESLSGNAEWTPQQCAERLEVLLKDYGQEHLILHPMVLRMLKAKMEQRSS